jgi:translation initiation factor 3 subunit E
MAAPQQAALAHDLSQKLMQYLDVHLNLPILEMVQERGMYDEEDVLRAKLALLDRTNMVRSQASAAQPGSA